MQTTLPMPATPRTANHLTLERTFKIGTWITEHKQMIQDEPDAVCAERAAQDLGFPITAANVTGHRLALHIEKTLPNTPPSLEDRVIELEQQNELLSRKCDSIDRNLAVQFTQILKTQAEKNELYYINVDQVLANLRAGYNDHQSRLTALEAPTPAPCSLPADPGRMASELPIDLPTDPGSHA